MGEMTKTMSAAAVVLLVACSITFSNGQSSRDLLNERLKKFDDFYDAQVKKISSASLRAATETNDLIHLLTVELQSLHNIVVEELHSMDEIEEKMQEGKKKQEELIKNLRIEKKQIEDKNKNLELETVGCLKEDYVLVAQIEELRKEKQIIAEQNDKDKETIKQNDDTIKAIQKENAAVRKINLDLNATLDDAMNRNEECEDMLNDVQNDNEDLKKASVALNASLTDAMDKNKKCEDTIKAIQEENADLQKRNSDMNATLEDA